MVKNNLTVQNVKHENENLFKILSLEAKWYKS